MSVIIRALGPDDAEIYRALRLRGLEEEPVSFGDSYEEASSRPLDYFRDGLQKYVQFGAFVENRLVGHAGAERHQGVKTRHKAWVWGVYVAPEARGKGVSKRLLQTVMDWAGAQAGLEQLHLSTDARNAHTQGLYASFGFEPYGTETHIFKLPDGSYVDDVLMVKFLTRGVAA